MYLIAPSLKTSLMQGGLIEYVHKSSVGGVTSSIKYDVMCKTVIGRAQLLTAGTVMGSID